MRPALPLCPRMPATPCTPPPCACSEASKVGLLPHLPYAQLQSELARLEALTTALTRYVGPSGSTSEWGGG